MKLTILGKYGPYPKEGGNTSGYLLQTAKTSIAFEMGSGVFSALMLKVEPEKLSAIVISHLHYDHIADIGILNYYLESLYRQGKLSSKIRLILPDIDCAALSMIEEMSFFEIEKVKEGEEIFVGDTRFVFFKTAHPIYCLGFSCFAEGKKFVYSADTDLCESLQNTLQSADFALLDGAFTEKQYRAGGPHMSAKICSELAAKHHVFTVVSHCSPNNSDEILKAELADKSICEIAEEGKSYFF